MLRAQEYKMKKLKILLAMLVLGAIITSFVGCGSKTQTTTVKTQDVAVKRGNLSVDITAAGNLALAQTEDMPVNLFYQVGSSGRGGTVGQVLVEVGDTVKKGQVLVSVDPTEWADQLQIVQDNVDTAQRNVTTKNTAVTDAERQLAALQRQVTTAETAVTKAQRQVTLKEFAVQQAQVAVDSANNTLHEITDVKKAQDAIDEAQMNLDIIKKLAAGEFGGWSTSTGDISVQVVNAQADLAAAREDYNDILDGTSIRVTSDVALQVAQSKLAFTSAQMAVVDAQTAVDDANIAVINAQQSVDDAKYAVTKQQQTLENTRADLESAKNNLADAQKKLADAEAMSPDITAPFDGFITAVNVKAGDSVYNGTIAVTVADPTKFEADILVSEMDIDKVKIGGVASVAVSALTGVTVPASVTYIAPTATIQSGVVNYSVKVELGSLPAASQNQTARPPQTGNVTAGALPPFLQQAVDSGRMTQQQAEDIVKNGPPSGAAAPGGNAFPGASGSQGGSQLPSSFATAQNVQLRQGLTVTVSIIIASRTSVLLVPNAAVTTAGGESSVQVVNANGTTEKRVVQIGLNDWQYTEITSGLSEGEKVSVPENLGTASSSSNRGPVGFFGPGR
jgi:HlyD family secretion protein